MKTPHRYNTGVNEAIPTWRVLPADPHPAAWQTALGASLLEARAGGLSPDTFREAAYAHPCILIGAHQLVPEGDGPFQRRITGGPAVAVDPRRLAWEFVASRGGSATGAIEALVETLRHHGYPVDPGPDCVILNRRAVAWFAETSWRRALLLQVFVAVVPCDGERGTTSLFEEGGGRAPSIEELRTSFGEALRKKLALSTEPGTLTAEERAHLASRLPEFRSDSWLHSVALPEGAVTEATTIGRGSAVRVAVVHGSRRNHVERVVFSGEFCTHPRGAVAELERELSGTSIDEAPARIENYFVRTGAEWVGLAPGDLFTALSLAFMKRRVSQSSAPDPEAWKKDAPR